jgi:cation transport ATPase
VKALFLAATLPGWVTLWLAIAADMGASLVVTLNGMRLLSYRGARSDAEPHVHSSEREHVRP